ncbi:restriction endonuclease subunit S [Bacillus pseudomycoides]|uniref:restriction endonuclease subunit S n=1 Tax=Bacillus pseudomycoides TaxID=64104 RepID=UPI003D65FBD3
MKFEMKKIEEIASVKGGKRLPKGDSLISEKTPYPYIRLVDIKNNQVDENNLQYLTEETHQSISKYIVEEDNVCLAVVGHTIGLVFYINKNMHGANLTENAVRLIINKNINPKYIYYFLNSPKGQSEILSRKVGSAQGKLPIYNVKNIEVPLPELDYQNKIVNILDNLDKKIRLNNMIISNLEQLSQTLFKHWFIDFEFPNEQGHPYKSSDGEMVESELGEIPKGWPVYKLDEFVESISNSIKKKEQPLARFLNTSDILNGEIMHKELDEVANMPGQAKKLIQKGDILYSEIRPKNKRHAYINFDSDEYVVSTKLMVLRVNETVYSGKVLYQWLASDTVINEFQQLAEDRSGTFPQITFSTIGHYRFAIPPIDIKDKLFNPLELMLDKRLNLMKENKKLAELRDTLLPKLLSGEFEIPDEVVVD